MYSMNNQIKTIEIGKGMTLEVREKHYHPGYYFYVVMNEKVKYGQTFCGTFEQLINKNYASLRQFNELSEQEFLKAIGV